jgi:hypothetical protein
MMINLGRASSPAHRTVQDLAPAADEEQGGSIPGPGTLVPRARRGPRQPRSGRQPASGSQSSDYPSSSDRTACSHGSWRYCSQHTRESRCKCKAGGCMESMALHIPVLQACIRIPQQAPSGAPPCPHRSRKSVQGGKREVQALELREQFGDGGWASPPPSAMVPLRAVACLTSRGGECHTYSHRLNGVPPPLQGSRGSARPLRHVCLSLIMRTWPHVSPRTLTRGGLADIDYKRVGLGGGAKGGPAFRRSFLTREIRKISIPKRSRVSPRSPLPTGRLILPSLSISKELQCLIAW